MRFFVTFKAKGAPDWHVTPESRTFVIDAPSPQTAIDEAHNEFHLELVQPYAEIHVRPYPETNP